MSILSEQLCPNTDEEEFHQRNLGYYRKDRLKLKFGQGKRKGELLKKSITPDYFK